MKKETVHVHYEIVIDKDVTCCGNCPYYKELRDMGATLSVCEALPCENYGDVLGDITWRDNNTKISKKCPLRKEK